MSFTGGCDFRVSAGVRIMFLSDRLCTVVIFNAPVAAAAATAAETVATSDPTKGTKTTFTAF